MVRTVPAVGRRRVWVPWTIALLWVVVVALTVSAPGFLSSESAAMYRSLRSLPGIVDACGSPTLFARLVPPALVLVGVALTFALDAGHRTVMVVRTIGMLLTIAIAFATLQNTTVGPTCILD